MMFRRRSGFALLFLLVGCGGDDPVTLPPTITGDVDLYDELGQRLPSADQVEVSALSLSSVRQYRTFTDAAGRFEIELPQEVAVPLMFSLDGFGDMFRYDVEEETGPIQVDMFARSSADPVTVSAVAEPCGTVDCLELNLEVDNFFRPETTRRLFRLYLSTDPNMSYFDYEFTDLLIVPNDQPGLVQNGVNATFQLDGLHGMLGSFPSGATVHMVVYGATENLSSSYPAPGTGLPIYTDLSGGSARTSFIMP